MFVAQGTLFVGLLYSADIPVMISGQWFPKSRPDKSICLMVVPPVNRVCFRRCYGLVTWAWQCKRLPRAMMAACYQPRVVLVL